MLLIPLLLLIATRLLLAHATDYTQYVSVFRGTQNGGNMFPGVVPGINTVRVYCQLIAILLELV